MRRRGFTLLEVAVAFCIFTVAATFLVTAMVNNMSRVETGHAFDDLIDLGRTRLEEAVAEGYPPKEEEGDWSDFQDTAGDIVHQGYAWRRIVRDATLPDWPEYAHSDEELRKKAGITEPYREVVVEVRRADEARRLDARVFSLHRLIPPPGAKNEQKKVDTGGGK